MCWFWCGPELSFFAPKTFHTLETFHSSKQVSAFSLQHKLSGSQMRVFKRNSSAQFMLQKMFMMAICTPVCTVQPAPWQKQQESHIFALSAILALGTNHMWEWLLFLITFKKLSKLPQIAHGSKSLTCWPVHSPKSKGTCSSAFCVWVTKVNKLDSEANRKEANDGNFFPLGIDSQSGTWVMAVGKGKIGCDNNSASMACGIFQHTNHKGTVAQISWKKNCQKKKIDPKKERKIDGKSTRPVPTRNKKNTHVGIRYHTETPLSFFWCDSEAENKSEARNKN